MTIRFGLIGCGRIAERHIGTIALCKQASLCALSDIQPERMKTAEMLYHKQMYDNQPIAKHEDYYKILKSPDIDAVIITTVSGLHAEIAKQALLHQKHVILEKPMALSIKDADDIIELANLNKLRVLVCHQLRYRPIMQKIKALISQNILGNIYLGVASIRLHRSQDYYSAAPWRGKWKEDGGMLINQGIHFVDLLSWFLGGVKKVTGEISKGTIAKETEDVALGILTFENGARGLIEANAITYPNNLGSTISIFGEKGTISIGGNSLNEVIRWSIKGDDKQIDEIETLLHDANEHLYMYEDFIRCILLENQNILVNEKEGKKALETIFSLYESATTSQQITLPLSSFSTSSMLEKTRWSL